MVGGVDGLTLAPSAAMHTNGNDAVDSGASAGGPGGVPSAGRPSGDSSSSGGGGGE